METTLAFNARILYRLMIITVYSLCMFFLSNVDETVRENSSMENLDNSFKRAFHYCIFHSFRLFEM